jgi:chromosome segregation ATPase
MAIKDISLISNHEIPEKGEKASIAWTSSNQGLDVGKDKLHALKDSIDNVNGLINERESLSKELDDEAESIKMGITNFFAETPTGEQEVREKIALKQKQVEISELQLRERVSCWQDVAKLKQELREKEQELSEKQGRFDMLNEILEDE